MNAISTLAPGKIVSYRRNPYIILEHRPDGTLLLSMKPITCSFGSSNNFAVSDLRDHLNCLYLDTLTQGHTDEVIPRTVDLTALNGSTEYGTCECKVAPLTLDELRKYHGIIPKPEVFEWSATPWSTPKVNEEDRWVLGLYSGGDLNGLVCSSTRGSRPAILLLATFIVDDIGIISSHDNADTLHGQRITDLEAFVCAKRMVNAVSDLEMEKALTFVKKVQDIPIYIDEPRFDVYDYVDAFYRSYDELDIDKCLALGRESFALVLRALAEKQREIYSKDVKPIGDSANDLIEQVARKTDLKRETASIKHDSCKE